MIYNPRKPSQNTPQVEVKVGGASMKFWMDPNAIRDQEVIEETLRSLTPGPYGWQAYATRGTRGTKWEGDNFGNGTTHPVGCNFALTVSGDGCSARAFSTAFEIYRSEIRRVVARS